MNTTFKPQLIIPLWLLTISFAFYWIAEYGATAGISSSPPQTIKLTQITSKTNNSQMLMFLHPQCSCSLASVNEMARLMSSLEKKPELHIYFVDTFEEKESLEYSTLWQLAQSIENANIHKDKNATTSKFFNSTTSGNVILYNPQGKLLFHGGITDSRGHEGDSIGKAAIKELLSGKVINSANTDVYGCGLHG